MPLVLLAVLLLLPRPGATVEVRRVSLPKPGSFNKGAPWAPGKRAAIVPPLRLEVSPQVHTSIQPAWRQGAQSEAPVVTDPLLEEEVRVTALQTPVPEAQEGRKRLLETLAETLPDPGTLGSEEARRDFERRAQLGGESSRWSAGTLGKESESPRLKRGSRTEKKRPPPADEEGLDPGGAKMRALLQELAASKEGVQRALGFIPSPKSLREISRLDFEVFLYRVRATGEWRIARGDEQGMGVSGEFEDYDVGLHNHVDLPIGNYTPYPQPDDLITSAGKDALFGVISVNGVAEWSSRIPFPDEPGRLLAKDAAPSEVREWVRQLEQGSWKRRFVMRLLFPSFYPELAKSLGVKMELKPWKSLTQAWLTQGREPVAELLDDPAVAAIRKSLKERLRVDPGDIGDDEIRARVAGYLEPYLASGLPEEGLADQLPLLTGHFGEEYSEFFRESHSWAAALSGNLDRLIQARLASRERSLRVKSLGVGTGQEPYSIAILIERALRESGEDPKAWNVVIDAYDVNAISLWSVKEGLFSSQVLGQIPPSDAAPTASLFEEVRPGVVRIHERLRSWIRPVFADLNDPRQHAILFSEPADVLFAKNTLMHLKLEPSQLLAERLLQGGWGAEDAPAFLNMDVLVAELLPPGQRGPATAKLANSDPVTFRVGLMQTPVESVHFTDKLWNRLASRRRTPLLDFLRRLQALWGWTRLTRLGEPLLLRASDGYARALREDPGHEEALDFQLVDYLRGESGEFELLADPRPWAVRGGVLALNPALLMKSSRLPADRRLRMLELIVAKAGLPRKAAKAGEPFFHPGRGEGAILARGVTGDGAIVKVVRFPDGDRLVWLAAARYRPFYGLRRE